MGLNLTYSSGQTPLDEDEKDGLLLPHISTVEELNEFEQQNIEEALQWVLSQRSIPKEKILTASFIRDVHRRMYRDVWKWAGTYRKSNKNIGEDTFQIPEALLNLTADCTVWIKQNVYKNDEIAVRFKHHLVSIHPFPNGNGRHSRLMADILIEYGLGGSPFTWGRSNLFHEGDVRSAYIGALKEADMENHEPLLKFARS
jgi:Fic-DOC domain mobile mystery protein B